MDNEILLKNSKSIFIVKEPVINFSQVRLTGQTSLKINQFIIEQEKRHLLLERGLRPRYRLLFHGPAGTGKTLVSEAIAHHLNRQLKIFNLEMLSQENPDSALKTIMQGLEEINSSSDIFLFDEFDAIAANRSGTLSSSAARHISNALLIAFERISSPAVIICATNFISCIDPAFRRRFDTICKFELPNITEREAILRQTLTKFNTPFDESDLKETALRTEGLSYHETEEVALCAIKRMLTQKKNSADLISEVPAALERRKTFLSNLDLS